MKCHDWQLRRAHRGADSGWRGNLILWTLTPNGITSTRWLHLYPWYLAFFFLPERELVTRHPYFLLRQCFHWNPSRSSRVLFWNSAAEGRTETDGVVREASPESSTSHPLRGSLGLERAAQKDGEDWPRNPKALANFISSLVIGRVCEEWTRWWHMALTSFTWLIMGKAQAVLWNWVVGEVSPQFLLGTHTHFSPRLDQCGWGSVMNSFPAGSLMGLFSNETPPPERITTLAPVSVQSLQHGEQKIQQYLTKHRCKHPEKPF